MIEQTIDELLAPYRSMRQDAIFELKKARESGRPVIGIFCAYTPRELILAAGAIPASLCGSSEEAIPFAESHLPRNLCPIVKSSYGLAISDTCPFFHFSNAIIGETTCDGKKKMYELLQRLKPMQIMHLPQVPEGPGSFEMWRAEVAAARDFLEEHCGCPIGDEDLRSAIKLTNRQMAAMKRFFDLNRLIPAPLKGSHLLDVAANFEFCTDAEAGVASLEKLVDLLEKKTAGGWSATLPGAPRILLTGTPVGADNDKIISLVEEGGGEIAAIETCGGYKTVELSIDEKDARDPVILLAEKYLKVPCSVMTPNPGRLELLNRMIDDFSIEGVIDLTWQACHTYNIEAFPVSELVREQKGLPYLHIETDFSQSDRENLRIRVEAFLEIVRSQQRAARAV